MNDMAIKFYGGVDEIGGNRILVEDGATKILLDYGMSFSKCGKFFEEYLKPRYASTGLKDLLRLHLVHYLPGIYRNDLLNLIGKDPHSTTSIAGLLLSHIHQDHSALISLLDEHIPIICSEITKAYAKALLDVGTRGLETEIYNFKRRPLDRRDDPIERTFLPCQSGKEVEIGKIKITPYVVDHSVLGATGYIISTSSTTIVYTGDLRLHGKIADDSEKFIEAAANVEPDIMLCEGTRIEETESASEDFVRKTRLARFRTRRA